MKLKIHWIVQGSSTGIRTPPGLTGDKAQVLVSLGI